MPNPSFLSAVPDDDRAEELDASYPDKFLECRSIGHQWRAIGYYHAYGEVVRALHCPRCDTDRHDRWSPGGSRLGNSYSYSSGYAIGNGGATKFEVRQETLRRVTIYDSADDMQRSLMAGKGKAARKAATG